MPSVRISWGLEQPEGTAAARSEGTAEPGSPARSLSRRVRGLQLMRTGHGDSFWREDRGTARRNLRADSNTYRRLEIRLRVPACVRPTDWSWTPSPASPVADAQSDPEPPAGHKVLPQHAVQYQELIEDYYKGIHESPDFDARLIGSWEIVVGDVDTFVHVFGYDGISGFEKTKYEIRASKVSTGWAPGFSDAERPNWPS